MGCVGLTEADAKVLFEWAPIGTSIAIVEKKEEDTDKEDKEKEE